MSGLAAQVIHYLLHGVLLAWLLSRTPTERLSDDQLALLTGTRVYVRWLVTCMHFVPGWLIAMMWISLCEATASRFLAMFRHKIEGSEEHLTQAAAAAASAL